MWYGRNRQVKGSVRSGPIISVFIHPLSKYILGIYYVLGIDVSKPRGCRRDRRKFLLLWSLCCSECSNIWNHNVSSGGED